MKQFTDVFDAFLNTGIKPGQLSIFGWFCFCLLSFWLLGFLLGVNTKADGDYSALLNDLSSPQFSMARCQKKEANAWEAEC